jgi:hypothetical protein
MPIEGYVDYKRREYCNDVKCPVQMIMNRKKEGTPEYNELRELCRSKCIHTTYDFHHWLIDKGFLVVRLENGK